MRISKSQLRHIIQEELSQVLLEADKGAPEGMSSEAWEEVDEQEVDWSAYRQQFPPRPPMTPEEEQEYVYRHGVPADAKPGEWSAQGPGTDYRAPATWTPPTDTGVGPPLAVPIGAGRGIPNVRPNPLTGMPKFPARRKP